AVVVTIAGAAIPATLNLTYFRREHANFMRRGDTYGPTLSVTPLALQPYAGRRNKWFRTKRGSAVPPTFLWSCDARWSRSNRRRTGCWLRRVPRRRGRALL